MRDQVSAVEGLEEAVEHVWRRRPVVLSNQSFVEQLVDLAVKERLL